VLVLLSAAAGRRHKPGRNCCRGSSPG